MDTISDETRQHLLERHREVQRLQERAKRVQEIARQADQGLRSATRVILLEKGLDPETHTVNLQTGVIQEVEDEEPPAEVESPNGKPEPVTDPQ